MPTSGSLVADVTSAIPSDDRTGRYALVIAGEVLEHVGGRRRVPAWLRAAARPGRPTVRDGPERVLSEDRVALARGRESVHPDHRVYYGPRTLERTLEGAGFELDVDRHVLRAGRRRARPSWSSTRCCDASHRVFQGPVGDGLIAVASAREKADAIAS